jgi:hypothetical protein
MPEKKEEGKERIKPLSAGSRSNNNRRKTLVYPQTLLPLRTSRRGKRKIRKPSLIQTTTPHGMPCR